jgi:hypothetical protein
MVTAVVTFSTVAHTSQGDHLAKSRSSTEGTSSKGQNESWHTGPKSVGETKKGASLGWPTV